MAARKKKKTKKRRASLVLFVIELIVLVVLVCAIFGYAKINEGLRKIGSATKSGQMTASAGNVTGLQNTYTGEDPAVATAAYTEEAAAGPSADVNGVSIGLKTDGSALEEQKEAAENIAAPAVYTGTEADPNADADAAEENEGISQLETMKGYTNIALVGIDTRDVDQIDYANSDTMIIASLNNETGRVRMVSLYRDTLLNIGNEYTIALSQGDSDEELGGEGEGEYIFIEDEADYDGDADTPGDYSEGGDDDTEYEGSYDDEGSGDYEEFVGDEEDYSDEGGEGTEDTPAYDDDGGNSEAVEDTPENEPSYDDGNDDYSEQEENTEHNTEESSEGSAGTAPSEDAGSSEGSGRGETTGENDFTGNQPEYSDEENRDTSDAADTGTSDNTDTDSADDSSDAGEDEAQDAADSESVSEYAAKEFYNYSEVSSAVTGPDGGQTTAAGRYDKANSAYANGSARQLLAMLNRNFDLNIHEYVVVDFSAVAMLVDDLDGIDVYMTEEEVIHMNNYCQETSKVTGLDYVPIEAQILPQYYHLNGVQAVSYARIRFTNGNDMKRTQRQRVVIQKVIDKAKERGFDAVTGMINDVFPLCKTSFSNAQIIKLAMQVFGFEIEKTSGFPFEHIEKNVYVGSKSLDAVVPVTLEDNVKELHAFLFDDYDYECSPTVKEYSNDISILSGLTEASRDVAKQNSIIGDTGGEADVVK